MSELDYSGSAPERPVYRDLQANPSIAAVLLQTVCFLKGFVADKAFLPVFGDCALSLVWYADLTIFLYTKSVAYHRHRTHPVY